MGSRWASKEPYSELRLPILLRPQLGLGVHKLVSPPPWGDFIDLNWTLKTETSLTNSNNWDYNENVNKILMYSLFPHREKHLLQNGSTVHKLRYPKGKVLEKRWQGFQCVCSPGRIHTCFLPPSPAVSYSSKQMTEATWRCCSIEPYDSLSTENSFLAQGRRESMEECLLCSTVSFNRQGTVTLCHWLFLPFHFKAFLA